jgi:hypothetical protein
MFGRLSALCDTVNVSRPFMLHRSFLFVKHLPKPHVSLSGLANAGHGPRCRAPQPSGHSASSCTLFTWFGCCSFPFFVAALRFSGALSQHTFCFTTSLLLPCPSLLTSYHPPTPHPPRAFYESTVFTCAHGINAGLREHSRSNLRYRSYSVAYPLALLHLIGLQAKGHRNAEKLEFQCFDN